MADNNQHQPAAEAAKLQQPVSNKTVFLWVWLFFSGLVFGGGGSIFLLTDAATADQMYGDRVPRFLLYGELGCSVAAVLAAPLHALLLLLLLTSTRTATTRNRWAAAAVDVLGWVALAATAGIHCMEVACDRIFFAAAHPEHKHNFAYVVFISFCLSVDLVLAGILLCCSPRPRLEDDQGDDDDDEI